MKKAIAIIYRNYTIDDFLDLKVARENLMMVEVSGEKSTEISNVAEESVTDYFGGAEPDEGCSKDDIVVFQGPEPIF